MSLDPLDVLANDADATGGAAADAAARARLNRRVAVTVALLATFTGVCKVKDDNIVQAMQQAQADRLDHWSYYQARHTREEVARTAADQFRVQAALLPPGAPAAGLAALRAATARADSVVVAEARKNTGLRAQAEQDQRTYDALNFRDDQFDLSDTLAALAISLLAVTSLTQQRWLYALAALVTGLAVLMGLAGLAGWALHPDAVVRLLS